MNMMSPVPRISENAKDLQVPENIPRDNSGSPNRKLKIKQADIKLSPNGKLKLLASSASGVREEYNEQ